MIVFLDTEFTDLSSAPRLLSVGMVTTSGDEFYAEVTDPDRLAVASRFARERVLSQFGRLADAACTHAQLGARAARFFTELARRCGPSETIQVAFECRFDWELLDRAVRQSDADSDAGRWGATRAHLRPTNVHNITGFAAGEIAADIYFRQQRLATICRHHALCDARALRIYYEAAVAATCGAVPAARTAVGLQIAPRPYPPSERSATSTRP